MSFSVTPPLPQVAQEITDSIRRQMASRAYRAANELKNQSAEVLGKQGGGRRYRMPHGKGYYTASAPGQPPASRTGTFKQRWTPSAEGTGNVFKGKIESTVQTSDYPGNHGGRSYLLGELLENGTSRMASRPYQDKILEAAEPEIVRIYNEPYF